MKHSIYLAGHRGLIGSAFLRRFQEEALPSPLVRLRSDLDLTNAKMVRDFFEQEKPKTVILAAGRTGGIAANQKSPADFMSENLAIQSNVFQAAQATNADRVLFFGSSCMYPRDCTQPMKEDHLLTGKPESTSISYAMAKLAGVYMCLAYNHQYAKQRFIPVIPNNVYGSGDDFDCETSHVLAALIRRFHEAKEERIRKVTLWGTGRPRREFIHADDLVDACLNLMAGDDIDCDLPVNISAGQDCSIKELAEMISNIVGFKGDIEWDPSKPDGAPMKLLDRSQLNERGWKAKVKLEDGIRLTYDWYVNHGITTRAKHQ